MSSPSEADIDRIVRRLDALLVIAGGATLTLVADVFGTDVAVLILVTAALVAFAIRDGRRSEGSKG